MNATLKQTGKPELDPARLEQKADRATADGKQSAMDAAADPAQAAELKQWFDRVKQSGEPTLSAADKDALVNIVAARTGKAAMKRAKSSITMLRLTSRRCRKWKNSRPRPSRKRVKRPTKRPNSCRAPLGVRC
ncbi:hypothetical protein M5585_11085 [Serratia ureilytica]